MSTDMKWEYRVEAFGSALSSVKDERLEEVLNEWGEEGWHLVSAYPVGDNKVRLIAERAVELGSSRRKRGWP